MMDETNTFPIPGVSVLSKSGRGTTTDSSGRYSIVLAESDSIYFSYLNKPTSKFAVNTIADPNAFNVAIRIPVAYLKEIRVLPRNYKMDSLQNRIDYAKVFNYKKPGLSITAPNTGALGVGLDLDQIIGMFSVQKNRRMALFQKRLIWEEHEKFIDHRFSRGVIRRLTKLDSTALDTFMIVFRPSYLFTASRSDYDFYDYIKKAGEAYKAGVRHNYLLRKEDYLNDYYDQDYHN
ncbi:hypothetical protein QJ048_02850 [Pinibacter sp. MAH-24]|uniref:Carboxypeptidase-like regulatory domain-containing protein n=1 Tax=Pinibacter soli TaxID=3044211 RepID=A0ABT6R9W0_9BACT|nr:hypothetical protein [Pinibacter soli]